MCIGAYKTQLIDLSAAGVTYDAWLSVNMYHGAFLLDVWFGFVIGLINLSPEV